MEDEFKFYIEVVTDDAGLYFWRIKSRNGETVAHSETYSTHYGARRAAKKIYKQTGLPWYDELRNS